MFSHLCRACLKQFNDPADIVPLFEPYENVVYYRICNELQLMMQQDDQLGCNLCKSCAENVMKFYRFLLTYKESDKRLRDMLKHGTVVVDEVIECKPNVFDLVNQQEVRTLSDIERAVEVIKAEKDDEEVDTIQFATKVPVVDPISLKWKCTKCLSGFRTRKLLEIHRKSHLLNPLEKKVVTSKRQSQCKICWSSFPSRKMLEQHNREQHFPQPAVRKSNANKTVEYECDICTKRFNSKGRIRQHLITHFNEGRRKFLCVACGNQFCTRFGLKQHISAIHDKEQRFQCTKCDRRFAHKHNLKTHMNRHNKYRPYPCKVCDKSFYDSSTLNVHTKSVHSDTNAYVCNICSKSFNRNGNLKIHMVKTHHIQHPKMPGSIQRVIMKVE